VDDVMGRTPAERNPMRVQRPDSAAGDGPKNLKNLKSTRPGGGKQGRKERANGAR
jgi:hypothetical protein